MLILLRLIITITTPSSNNHHHRTLHPRTTTVIILHLHLRSGAILRLWGPILQHNKLPTILTRRWCLPLRQMLATEPTLRVVMRQPRELPRLLLLTCHDAEITCLQERLRGPTQYQRLLWKMRQGAEVDTVASINLLRHKPQTIITTPFLPNFPITCHRHRVEVAAALHRDFHPPYMQRLLQMILLLLASPSREVP